MKNKLLIALGCVAGIVAVRVLMVAPNWFKVRRENREFIATNNVTPDRLVARCGPALADATKNLYPMVARDMNYRSDSGGTIVFKFSKTAEESSDWVFMSMQDSATGAAYETPEAKVTAMSCLDSRK
jgi:hypothetical protein